MKYEILKNKVFRLPMSKAIALIGEYEATVGFKSFAEQQKVLDILAHKDNVIKQINPEAIQRFMMCLVFMLKLKPFQARSFFEEIKGYPLIIWFECIGEIDSQSIMNLLSKYHKEFSPVLIETFILSLPSDKQVSAISMYKSFIKPNEPTFLSFYYSVSSKARRALRGFFPDQIDDDILLELNDLDEEGIIDKLVCNKGRLKKIPFDDILEFILLKANNKNTLRRFIDLFLDRFKDASDSKFKLFIARYKYLCNKRFNVYDDDDYDYKSDKDDLLDEDLFNMFKDRFRQIGVKETLAMFDHKVGCQIDDFNIMVIIEFIDMLTDEDLSKYVNEKMVAQIIEGFVKKCNSREYSLSDFESLVGRIEKNRKTKMFHDDYIEAIIACGKLLRSNEINNQHPLFLKLRESFIKDLINRCEKDGTYLEDISLNGVFYRLAKGSMPFSKVYMTKTYRGLIYLSKAGKLIDNADYITTFLTDELLAKMNITPVVRWKNNLSRTEVSADSLAFVERMGLQLLCYFGFDKAKYLLESNMRGNRMEGLFDGLNYDKIQLDVNGNPKLNEELISFLFGSGRLREPSSNINRMIRYEIPAFERRFTDFCNSFERIKKACNNVLTVKRVIKFFDDARFPIALKPDEIEFKHALSEMNTISPDLLKEAIGLCKDARERTYSSIPKVKGKLGDFEYEMLDLKDPLAVAVGYLSHCCFVINGVTYSSLKHSMQSTNGRTFVVYYKGKFTSQSWVWRNGDVICFDSIEAGSAYHFGYTDDIGIREVYRCAANEIMDISRENEDELQRVKCVTVGKSDYVLEDLKPVMGDCAVPIERNVEIYDSRMQWVLAGKIPENPRYGEVGAKYTDNRKSVTCIKDVGNVDIDRLDELTLNVCSLRYRINGIEDAIQYDKYDVIISGDGWYILVDKEGNVESGALKNDDRIAPEFNKYMSTVNDYVGKPIGVGSFAPHGIKPLR